MRLILSHSADLDGLASAALLLHHHGAGEVRLTDYPELVPTLEAVSHEPVQELQIVDLALRESEVPDAIISALSRERAVHYIDHHDLEPHRRRLLEQRFATVVLGRKRCTALLILEHLGIQGSGHRLLAEAAQATDYPETDLPQPVTTLGLALDRAARALDGLAVVEILLSGLNEPNATPWQLDHELVGELRRSYEQVTARLARPLADLERQISHHNVRGPDEKPMTVACTLASEKLYMKEGLRELRRLCPKSELLVVFFESRAVMAALSAEGRQRGLDLVRFMASREGGGRDGMGGFRYPSPTSRDNYPGRRDALLRELERFWAGNHSNGSDGGP
jgi:hypothetical protein